MHNLVIDIGNTNHKLAIFKGRDLVHYQSTKQITAVVIKDLISQYGVTASTISSVGKEHQAEVELLKLETKFYPFSTIFELGVKNFYGTPQTLGLDRWAKVVAANHQYAGTPCFIIDAGTCITYDLLNCDSAYFGGSISPGIGMRFAALNHYTKRLPLLEWNTNEANIPVGVDTATGIRNGVLQGVVSEVEGNIALQDKINKGLNVLLTGGDATFLLEQLKNSIFAPQIIHDPYLVLKGLNEVIAFEYVQKN
ncbi:MAG: type III pantothenate kinase [Pedobacter sp.]|nr:type III pantothenate kinase [Pedobacter sp.]